MLLEFQGVTRSSCSFQKHRLDDLGDRFHHGYASRQVSDVGFQQPRLVQIIQVLKYTAETLAEKVINQDFSKK